MADGLLGHRAFVTGSTRGIGAAMADAIFAAGAPVMRHGLPGSADPASDDSILFADLVEELPESPRQLVARVLERQPETDLLVCNAGVYLDEPFPEMSFATFRRTMDINVAAPFVVVQEFARHWIAESIRGRVVLTGSINGRLSEPVHVAYDTSKGAVDALVRSLSVTLAPLGIRVNGVAPGLVRTPLTEPALRDPAVCRWMELHTPNGRIPGPDACAGAAVFLLSDAAEHIHGQMLLVDGGMSIWQQPDMPPAWSGD